MSSDTGPDERAGRSASIARAAAIAIGTALLVAGYLWLAHDLIVEPGAARTLIVLLPLAGAVALAWRTRLRVPALWLLLLAAAGLLLRPASAPVLLLAIHASANLALLWLFARTLRRGAVPLATRIAQGVRGTLPPELVAYTRRVTQAWCAFFGVMAALSIGLFLIAPLPVWSAFANLLNLPLVALMFACEYAWRLWRYRHLPHASVLASIRGFRRWGGAPPQTPRC
jgi:uncharacterized membrane protein